MTTHTTTLKNLLTTPQAADRLGLSPTTLEIWRWRGTGPKFRKLGKAVRYAEEDLDAFVEAASRTNTSEQPRKLTAI